MKKILMSLAVATCTVAGVQAQVNKTVKQESTVKRVVTKEGSEVKVKEIKDTNTEAGAVIVEGNNETNQEFREATVKGQNQDVVVDDVNINAANEEKLMAIKQRQQAELEMAIKAQKEKNEMEAERIRAEKKAELQRQMEEKRAMLERRPEGMSKLSSNRD
ncbi:hypothetical protein [Aequorivita echinoideorum]|uniref:Uncharacterized protein n=1 Tax=Aequorivita echinoideorum TaxID=1549647 RepID=A0ABS5S5S1_9FLAO|nr:hypothetical protein [Aequorivita echinoideorum]MBT0608570.1 hypothetical protein [Aequorivita echinoideorum]